MRYHGCSDPAQEARAVQEGDSVTTDEESEQRLAILRKAHELSATHGKRAHVYAAKLAAEAAAEDAEDKEFWKSVELTLSPRSTKNSS